MRRLAAWVCTWAAMVCLTAAFAFGYAYIVLRAIAPEVRPCNDPGK